MKCPICLHGDTQLGVVTVTLERGDSRIVFRHVPGEICENCGESFHSADITEALLRQAETAVAEGVERRKKVCRGGLIHDAEYPNTLLCSILASF